MLNSQFATLRVGGEHKYCELVPLKAGAYSNLENASEFEICRDGEMAYAQDLKSCDRKVMRVRLPLPAP